MASEKRSLIDSIRTGATRGRALAERHRPDFKTDAVPIGELEKAFQKALDRIEGSLLEREWARIHFSWVAAAPEAPAELARSAEESLIRLRQVEASHFGPIRAQLRLGSYGPKELRADIETRPSIEADVFVDRLFDVYDVPQLTKVAGFENSPFLNSSVHDVRPLFDLVKPSDTFFDLGSGLGKVLFLVRFLTGARTIGIEYDAPLVAAAEAARRELDLEVEMMTADARDVDYRDGTFFYFFEPFRGAVMEAVLEKIKEAALRRQIRLAVRWVTNHPFTPAEWMVPVGDVGRLSLFESRTL